MIPNWDYLKSLMQKLCIYILSKSNTSFFRVHNKNKTMYVQELWDLTVKKFLKLQKCCHMFWLRIFFLLV